MEQASDAHVRYSKEFQLFVQNVLIGDLSKETFRLFCFNLEVPQRTLDDVTDKDRSAIMWYLKHQMLLEKWKQEPALLIEILTDLKRLDLSSKLEQLVDKYKPLQTAVPEEGEKVPIQESRQNSSCQDLPIQETHESEQFVEQDGCISTAQPTTAENQNDSSLPETMTTALRQTDTVNKRPKKRHVTFDKEKRRALFEPVPEEDVLGSNSGKFSDSGVVVTGDQRDKICSPTSSEKKEFYDFFKSEKIQEDYGKKTVDGVLSDYNEHLQTKNPSHTSVSRTPSNVSKASERSSGYYSVRSSILSQLSLRSSMIDGQDENIITVQDDDDGFQEPYFCGSNFRRDEGDPFVDTEFRLRSSSFPSNGHRPLTRSPPGNYLRKVTPRHVSSSSSSTSLASDDSETTNTSSGDSSQYNSQSSLADHSTLADATNSVARRKISCPVVRYHPLKEIMGKMELSAKDIRKDISKQRRREHKSSPFLHSKDLQYEMRFYPLMTGKENINAALYIDASVATETCLKCCVKEEEANKPCDCEIEVPRMDVRVSIHTRESGERSKCDGGGGNHGDVGSKCIVRGQAQVEGVRCNFKSKKTLTIAQFPDLVSVEELRNIKKGRIISVEAVLRVL